MNLIKTFCQDIYLDLSIFTVFLFYILKHFNHEITIQVIGLILSLLFLLLWVIARINLGSAFTVTPIASKLVTSGLYSKIKHPIYLFSALSYFSLLLIFRSPLLYLIGLCIILLQIYRSRLENKRLKESFPENYDKYSKKTLL
jgi:protein-S-isoprenylcysteine O-methyltransferase Ste14